MKRFVAVLAGLLALPAFADNILMRHEEEVRSGTISRDVDTSVSATAAGRASNRVSGNRAGVARAVPSTGSSAKTRSSNAASGRVVASNRAAVVAPADGERRAVSRTANAASVISRNAMPGVRGSVVGRAATTAPRVASRVNTRAATMTTNIAKKDSGVSVTNSETESAAAVVTPSGVASQMENLASLTALCKAQYTECMDNFCNVLDDNQGRCSCSKNVKNYEKTESALKAATEALQDVAQQIQYIGLSKDEIEILFSQTEAELQMQASSDNSQLKNDLDKIKGLIVEVKSGTASSSEVASGLSMDLSGMLDFNISSNGFDLSSMFGTKTANTSSISNQRGEQLYKTAAARCRTAVLSECQSQGVDISIVSNAYDMEIDKQCVAYERSLTDANDEMGQTVRNAKSVLQRARLMVAQQKNAYDLRGCINALDSCMQDDFVCGNDYENCLDPSGKYIADGAVVIGSTPGQPVDDYSDMGAATYSTDGLYSAWNYSNDSVNAWGASNGVDEGSLSEYIKATINGVPNDIGSTISEFLQYKIGYIQNNKSYGMCSSVLNKCQDYTYVNGEYSPKNRVVEEYLSRTLVKIKTAQDKVLSDYAERCISDVSSCLGENNYDESAPSGSKSRIAINACRSQIVTCMSVNGRADAEPTPAGMADWVYNVINSATAGSTAGTTLSGEAKCTSQGGTWGSNICTCPSGSSLNSNGYCYIASHRNSQNSPSCSGLSASANWNGSMCVPTAVSCAEVNATWSSQTQTCYCTGTYSANTQSSGYSGYVCK